MATPPAPQTPEQPAAPSQFDAPVAPSEPVKKKGGLGKKILGIVVAIAVALVVKFGWAALAGDLPVHAEVGDCVVVTGPENKPEVETQDCSVKKDDLYKVTKVIDGTFDLTKCGEVSALAQEWEHEKFVLCMEPVKN
ncbi:hypothetical protein ABZZ37_03495 [Streptomyces sp. NPDC006464]|uniref:LppU/SCO3897 family protein n=1 Tax=Streptomyces sp. NPDC006464 TaxID=3154305 RepID=UPI0033A23862